MVQRAGRIDRIGTEFDTLFIHNMFPEEGLERLLRLVESLSPQDRRHRQRRFPRRERPGRSGPSSQLQHPAAHPRRGRQRHRRGGAVHRAGEQRIPPADPARCSAGEGRERLEDLPDGIHSGLMKPRAKGLFFYFQAQAPEGGKLHFWKYYDLVENRIIDNRFIIANLIACDRDTPRVVGDYDVFAAQERVIEDILRGYQEQQALDEAPKTVDPLQQTVATTIQSYMNRPEVNRQEALAAIRFLSAQRSRWS